MVNKENDLEVDAIGNVRVSNRMCYKKLHDSDKVHFSFQAMVLYLYLLTRDHKRIYLCCFPML